MVSEMQTRPMWIAVDHVCHSNSAGRHRDVLIHPTVLVEFVDQIFVKVSLVTRNRISTSTESVILSTSNKYLYTDA